MPLKDEVAPDPCRRLISSFRYSIEREPNKLSLGVNERSSRVALKQLSVIGFRSVELTVPDNRWRTTFDTWSGTACNAAVTPSLPA